MKFFLTCLTDKMQFTLSTHLTRFSDLTREAGISIKPRASARGKTNQKDQEAIEDSDSRLILLGCRPFHGLARFYYRRPPRSRTGLYAITVFDG